MKSLLVMSLRTFSFIGTAVLTAQEIKDASDLPPRPRLLEKLQPTEAQKKDLEELHSTSQNNESPSGQK